MKRCIVTILVVAFIVESSGVGFSSALARTKKYLLRPMATGARTGWPFSDAVRPKGVLTEEQKGYWRPRLLNVLRMRDFLTEEKMVSGVDAFLSINGNLFTKDTGKKKGLRRLYQVFDRARRDIDSDIPQYASLHYVILKEFGVIDFSRCVGYCREAIFRNDISAATEVMEVIEELYEKEIASFAAYAQLAEVLDRKIVQLSDSIYELGSGFAIFASELYYDWNRFINEDRLRRVEEVGNFLGKFCERLKTVRRHKVEFLRVVGKGDGLSATYMEAEQHFKKVITEFIRLKRAIRRLSNDEKISSQWIEDNIIEGGLLQESLSLGRNIEVRSLSGEGPEDTIGDGADLEETDKTGEPDVDLKNLSKEQRIRLEYIATLPAIEEFADCEDALSDAETILEFTGSLVSSDPLAEYEVEEALKRLLTPGFVDKLEMEYDKQRWYDAVSGLINLLPAETAKRYERPTDFLKQTILTKQFDSAA